MSGVERLRRFRQRRADGRGIWKIENDVVAVEHLLEAAKLLPAGTEHSPADVQTALNKLITILIADAAADETRFGNKL